jgi:small subunit ribosomal protein S8
MTDPIGDLFARLKNGWKIRKKKIEVPYSNVKIAILKIMKDKNIIGDFSVAEKSFVISLIYDENGLAPVENIARISKPGRRVYAQYKDLKPVRQGYGFKIISTSRGIMTDSEAKKRKLGGEVIGEII